MSKLWKRVLLLGLGGMFMASSLVSAHPVRTPEGNMPMVHWAVLESTPGDMEAMMKAAAENVAPFSANEPGTYILYGGIDASNTDTMRLLEIYESLEAYRIHSTSEGFQAYRAARLPILKSLKILEANGIALEQKDSGTAKVVFMHRYEVAPERLLEYQRMATAEAVRSVREDDGVMGMFVTAEHDRPNIIHTMELYRNWAAYEAYSSSNACRDFQEKVAQMFISSRTIENLKANIILSNKGIQAKK